jgi:Ni/Fe-hydrogenase subunit HybB-like protein
MARIMLGMLAVFLIVRVGDLVVRGALGHAFSPSLEAFFFWLEMGFFAAPFLFVGTPGARRNPARLFLAGVSIMMGGILLRINGFLIGYDTGLGVDHGWNYFPSIAEMLVTIGMFAIEVLGYIIITRRFPVLPRPEAAH